MLATITDAGQMSVYNACDNCDAKRLFVPIVRQAVSTVSLAAHDHMIATNMRMDELSHLLPLVLVGSMPNEGLRVRQALAATLKRLVTTTLIADTTKPRSLLEQLTFAVEYAKSSDMPITISISARNELATRLSLRRILRHDFRLWVDGQRLEIRTMCCGGWGHVATTLFRCLFDTVPVVGNPTVRKA